MSTSAKFSSVSADSITVNEHMNTSSTGLFIPPSSVPGRSDVDGYCLTALDSTGKCGWKSFDEALDNTVLDYIKLETKKAVSDEHKLNIVGYFGNSGPNECIALPDIDENYNIIICTFAKIELSQPYIAMEQWTILNWK